MEMKYKEIGFKPYDPEHNDLNCEDGELEGAAGTQTPGFDVRFTLEAGELIAIHKERAIVYHEGKLMWAPAADGAHIAVDDLIEIAAMPRPASAAIMGDLLITTGDGGLLYHRRRDGAYITLPQLPPLPTIEFGLLKAGEMADTCGLTIPVSMMPSQSGDGMTDPHPSANITGGADASDHIDEFTETFILRAHDDKRSRGYFTTPFFVRYAIKDHEGNCLRVSPPVLMAGNVLPPCMEVLSTTKDEKNVTIRTRLTSSPYFSLMMRACSLSAGWIEEIGSIDIYVSPQISTWASSAGYLCSYANVLGQVNGGSGHRGRDSAGTSADTMFAGHYSDDSVNYTDHFTDPAVRQTQVWYVSPNIAMASEIVAVNRYYRIASLAPDGLSGLTAFMPVPVESTSTVRLESYEKLTDDHESATIFPDVLATLNGRLVAAGGHRGLPAPPHPAIASAFAGSTSGIPSSPVTIDVFTRISSGILTRVSALYDSSIDFTSAFPRYIYYPDSAAEMMTIETGSIRYRLPLTRHPFLPGAFWFGGLGKDYRPLPDIAPLPVAAESARIPCADRLWLSSPHSPSHFSLSQSIVACNSQIRAVSTYVATPDLSVIGKYPVYVFADDGVWLTEYDSSRLRLCGSHRISGQICVSATAVTSADEGVIFATDRSLLMLSGTKIRQLMTLRSLSMPRKTLFCEEGGFNATIPPSPVISPMLAYDGATSTLIVADKASGTAYLCDIVSRTGTLWHRKVISLPLSPGRPPILTGDHEVGYLLGPLPAGITGNILTRPIKLTKTFTPKIIRSVTIWHSGSPDSISLKIYGANSLDSWHLIASSPCHRAELASRSCWRFFRIAVFTKETGPSPEIFGAQLEWKD